LHACSTTIRTGLPHFGELWLAGSQGGGITSEMYASTHWSHATAPGEARWGQSELGAAASRKAVWWNLRLASLLTRLY